ncbi:HNH endonuclease [Streptomyces mirabilis]
MPQGRPSIPTELKRTVLLEAGHRCAIPTCRQHPVEVAHIIPWAKVKEHKFDNLIALCPTCHVRYDRNEIDRKSMLQYKANLEVLNHRYTDLERQLLKAFVRRWQKMREYVPSFTLADVATYTGMGSVRIYADMWWAVTNLLDDGVIELREEKRKELQIQEEIRNAKVVILTEKGIEFLTHWISAEPL